MRINLFQPIQSEKEYQIAKGHLVVGGIIFIIALVTSCVLINTSTIATITIFAVSMASLSYGFYHVHRMDQFKRPNVGPHKFQVT